MSETNDSGGSQAAQAESTEQTSEAADAAPEARDAERADQLCGDGDDAQGGDPVELKAEGGDGEWTGERWKCVDGTNYHTMVEDTCVDQLDDIDNGVNVEKEVPCQLADENGDLTRNGRADLVVNENVCDFKTDQRDQWSETTAYNRGDAYGKQVKEYVDSPSTPDDAKGHLVMVGRESSDAEKRESLRGAFDRGAEQHGVNVIHCEDPEPDAVAQDIKREMID